MVKRRRPEYEEFPPWAQLLVAILFIGALVWAFVLQPLIAWLQQNWIPIAIGFIVIIFGIVFYFARKWKREEIFEQEQIAKGLVKFVDRHGEENWVKSEDLEKLKKEDEELKQKESLFNRVIKEIEDFRPAREQLRNEYAYHLSLFSWLNKTFPETEYEKQKGHSRPDIVVGDIAIEIKGPTDTQALSTIADKCMRYAKHFQSLIVVLFEVHVNPERYEEWLEGLRRTFPSVEVIRK
jgi:hypothetical protein